MTTQTLATPLVAFVRATLDRKDAERRIDETRADAMGEVLTLINAGRKAVALEHEVIYVKGGTIVNVHGTLSAVAKAKGLRDDPEGETAVEQLLKELVAEHKTGLQFTKRADSLRVV